MHLTFQDFYTHKSYVSHEIQEADNHDTEYYRSSEGSSFIVAWAFFNLLQYLDSRVSSRSLTVSLAWVPDLHSHTQGMLS